MEGNQTSARENHSTYILMTKSPKNLIGWISAYDHLYSILLLLLLKFKKIKHLNFIKIYFWSQ